jgi:hypothetical protein
MVDVESLWEFVTTEERNQGVKSYSEPEVRVLEQINASRNPAFTICRLITRDLKRNHRYFEGSDSEITPENSAAFDTGETANWKPDSSI